MKDILYQLNDFAINPKSFIGQKESIVNKLKGTFYLLLTYIIIAFSLGFILLGINFLLSHFWSIDINKNRAELMTKLALKFSRNNLKIIAILIAPFIEECMFRLWLDFKKLSLAISSFIIVFSIISLLNSSSIYSALFHPLTLTFFLALTPSLITFLLIYIFCKKNKINKILTPNFNYIFYLSSILFGIVHIMNFRPLIYSLFWIYPLFVLPQIILGFILGFVRVKNGFIWALLLHILINALSTF